MYTPLNEEKFEKNEKMEEKSVRKIVVFLILNERKNILGINEYFLS